MRTFRFNKLVRDKIVASQAQNGATADHYVLNETDYLVALKAKLVEEASELDATDQTALLGELADVQEVLDAMLMAGGHSRTELTAAQKVKNAKAGAFKKRHFVRTVTLQDDDPWIEYYLKNADRYPEIK